MLKYIYTALAAGIIITMNILWGSVISWFLSLTILAIIVYFVVQLQLEDIVNTVFQKKQKDIGNDPGIGHKLFLFGKKWEGILKFTVLSVVFVLGVWCIYTTTHPFGNRTWFLNNDYHGLSNAGIAFQDQLFLESTATDSNARTGNITVKGNGSTASLQFDRFFIPVFKPVDGRKAALLNNIYPRPIRQSLQLSNADFDVTIQVAPYEPGFFRKLVSDEKDGLKFTVSLTGKNPEILSQWNVQAPYQDHITIITSDLNIGKQLFELLLNGRSFESGKPESYQVLEAMLQELGDSYLLAHFENTDKQYKFFPGKNVFENNYTVKIDGQPAAPQLKNTSGIAYAEKFYIGFSNHRKQLYIDRFDATGYPQSRKMDAALYFDYPNTYMLRSPGKTSSKAFYSTPTSS